MNGPLAFVGSGEYTDKMLSVDEFLLSKIHRIPHVALFATAAAPEPDFKKWEEMGVSHFAKLNVEAVPIALYGGSDARDESLVNSLSHFNFFYFSGGNPGYLLDILNGSPVWAKILELHKQGAVLAGCSAGAMVMGETVWARCFDYYNDKKMVPWEAGLGLAAFGVIPHYDAQPRYHNEKEIAEIEANYPAGHRLIGIDEDTAYIKVGSEWTVMGSGSLHEIQNA